MGHPGRRGLYGKPQRLERLMRQIPARTAWKCRIPRVRENTKKYKIFNEINYPNRTGALQLMI